jgi:molecular chaperone GrpE
MAKDKDEKMKDEPINTAPEADQKPAEKQEPTIESQIEGLASELQDVKDKYLRALAEMENFKKRNNEEVARERKYASMTVCDKMIDSIDIFDKALSVQTDDPNFKNFLYGFKMIKDMMFNVLAEEGVKEIDVQIGDLFDPNVAHAIETTADESKNDNVVVKIVHKGFKYKDRLLRPAMVVINLKPNAPADSKESDNAKIDSNIA